MSINDLYEEINGLGSSVNIALMTFDKERTEKERLAALAVGENCIYCAQYNFSFFNLDDLEDLDLIEIILNEPIMKIFAKDDKIYYQIDGDAKVFDNWLF